MTVQGVLPSLHTNIHIRFTKSLCIVIFVWSSVADPVSIGSFSDLDNVLGTSTPVWQKGLQKNIVNLFLCFESWIFPLYGLDLLVQGVPYRVVLKSFMYSTDKCTGF